MQFDDNTSIFSCFHFFLNNLRKDSSFIPTVHKKFYPAFFIDLKFKKFLCLLSEQLNEAKQFRDTYNIIFS